MFSDWIKTERKAKGWSQADIAKAAGVTQSYVSALELDQRTPSRTVIERIAEALDIEVRPGLRAAGFLPDDSNFVELDNRESQMLAAYRHRIDMQPAIDTLLGIRDVDDDSERELEPGEFAPGEMDIE